MTEVLAALTVPLHDRTEHQNGVQYTAITNGMISLVSPASMTGLSGKVNAIKKKGDYKPSIFLPLKENRHTHLVCIQLAPNSAAHVVIHPL